MDRYVQLSHTILKHLREDYLKSKPKMWLFEGAGGEQYSPSSVLNVVEKAGKHAGIKNESYATYPAAQLRNSSLGDGNGSQTSSRVVGSCQFKSDRNLYTYIGEKL